MRQKEIKMYNLINFLSSSVSSSSGSTPKQNNIFTYIIFGVLAIMIIVYFFFSSRQNKKRREEAEAKVNNMQIGDKVKTIGGICGTVAEINEEENTFVLKTGMDDCPNYIKFDKVAIYQIEKAETFNTETEAAQATETEQTATEEATDSETTEPATEESAEGTEDSEENN